MKFQEKVWTFARFWGKLYIRKEMGDSGMQKGRSKRAFLIVLDGFGIGEAPDAEKFGDVGANTLKSVYRTNRAHIDTLLSLGLGRIEGNDFLPDVTPCGVYARMSERSGGKDTTVGHWELCGLASERALPTYPDGFPQALLDALSRATGRGILCNRPYSGTQVIADYGEEHLRSGDLIVYTSADSVCQIAAHESLIPPEALYEICRQAREIFAGEHAVGRIIARPFEGEAPHFVRTERRRDFSLAPRGETLLDRLSRDGYDVIGVGKIEDIFVSRGLTDSIHTGNNGEGMQATLSLLDRDFHGLAFVNLVDFDMVYGHRRNAVGYADALSACDRFLSQMMARMRDDDLLIVTADHGTDPGFLATTDHTREDVPFLAYRRGVRAHNGGCVQGFGAVANTLAELFCVPTFDGFASFAHAL